MCGNRTPREVPALAVAQASAAAPVVVAEKPTWDELCAAAAAQASDAAPRPSKARKSKSKNSVKKGRGR